MNRAITQYENAVVYPEGDPNTYQRRMTEINNAVTGDYPDAQVHSVHLSANDAGDTTVLYVIEWFTE